MSNLTRASRELFRRTPDETYSSLEALLNRCHQQREKSEDHWISPTALWTRPMGSDRLQLTAGEDKALAMNDWSFGQLCRLAGVTKETVNRLTPDTASRVFAETLPRGNKPLQVYAQEDRARSIHGASYTRLYDVELLDIVVECATGFEPPPRGSTGGTGLYGGEQDMFVFLIDPQGWTDIGGETFAPGFFLWKGHRAGDADQAGQRHRRGDGGPGEGRHRPIVGPASDRVGSGAGPVHRVLHGGRLDPALAPACECRRPNRTRSAGRQIVDVGRVAASCRPFQVPR